MRTILRDSIRIERPCSENWEAMEGDAQCRHCTKCGENVFNLSAMTESEAEDFLVGQLTTEKLPCLRYYQRADGTVKFADCSTTPAHNRSRGLGIAGAVTAAGLALSSCAQEEEACLMGVPPLPPAASK